MKTETSKSLAHNLLLSVLLCAFFLTFPSRAQAEQDAPAECLFNWAELNYPALFAPAGSTQFLNVYSYRYYPATNAYLGVNSVNNHVYYLGPDGVLQDVGPLSDWSPKAGCHVPPPPPAECLFNWAEKNYPGLFAPSGSPWAISSIDWTYRYYSLTNAYLRIQSSDNHVYYQGPDGLSQDVGPLADWTSKASCRPPVANAGPDQTAYVSETITLDGSASSDLDGNLITYQWTLTQKPAGSQTELSTPTALHPTLAIDKPGTYLISLVVNDGTMTSDPDTVTVSTIDSPPVADLCSKTLVTVPIPTIQQILPASAPTGAKVSIYGSGFSSCSRVFVAGKEVAKAELVSDSQLQIFVPFDVNNQNQIIPLTAGTYPIKVDSSATYNFEVTELPSNPNPAGQLLYSSVNSIFQDLNQSFIEFQAIAPQLLQDAQNDPNRKNFIEQLNDLATYLSDQGEAKTNQLIGQIDSQSLNTLESALLVSQNSAEFTQSPDSLGILQKNTQQGVPMLQPQTLQSAGPFNAADCENEKDGDKWLECRYNDVNYALLTKKYDAWFNWCTSGAARLSAAPLKGICATLGVVTFIASICKEINVAWHSGVVKGFELNITRMDGDDSADFTDGSNRKFVMYLNNYDNNEDTLLQTAKAKNVSSATLHISNEPDWINIAYAILDKIRSVRNIKTGDFVVDLIIKKTLKLWTGRFNEDVNKPNSTKQISLGKIKSEAGWLLRDTCDIADAKSIYLKTTGYKWVVPDVAPNLMAGQFMHSPTTCKFRVADYYRLPSENNVKSTVDFFVKRYPYLTIKVNGTGSVGYSKTPLSGIVTCKGGVTSHCTEYFDLTLGEESSFMLTSVASTFDQTVSWKLNGAAICTDKVDCIIPLSFNNDPAVNVQASFRLLDIAVDDTASTAINTPVTIDVKANDSGPDGTTTDKLTIINATVEGGSAKGSVVVNPDGTITFTPAYGVTGNVIVKYQLADPGGAQSNVANVTITLSLTHWAGSYVITECTPFPPSGPQWYWGNLCNAKELFFFDDLSPDVIFESSNAGMGRGVRSVNALGWSSSQSAFSRTIPTAFWFNALSLKLNNNNSGYTYALIEEHGQVSYVFTVINRTPVSISGTFTATTPSGYFENSTQFIEYWRTLQTSASGTWSAALVRGSKPQTQMNGYDLCLFDNSAYNYCSTQECTFLPFYKNACRYQ